MGSFNGHLTFWAQNEKRFVCSLNSTLWWLNLGHHSQQIFIFTELKFKEQNLIKSWDILSQGSDDMLKSCNFPCTKISWKLKPAWANLLINDVTFKRSKYTWWQAISDLMKPWKDWNQSTVCTRQYGVRHHDLNQPQGWNQMSHPPLKSLCDS